MNKFKLDRRLEGDCFNMGELNGSCVLLMNNALLPWFILVPKTDVTELCDLPRDDQSNLLSNINIISGFIRQHFSIDKLNVAAIGNIVSQLHIHVVGRSKTDFCWPNVVWGTSQRTEYSPERLEEIQSKLAPVLNDSR